MDDTAYALQKVKGIRKVFNNASENNIKEYMKQRYIKFYNTPEVSEIYTSTEGMDGYKEVGKLETPPSMSLEDGYSVTITEKRHAGGLVLPENVYRRDGQDNTWKVNQFLKEQRNQALLTATQLLMTDAHLMLNEAFDSTSSYLAPDSVEVCGTHSWASGSTFTNYATSALDQTSYDTDWETAGAYVDPAGKENPLNWSHIVVKKGSAAHAQAIKMFAKEITPTSVNDINIYEGMLTVIETPYITTANKSAYFLYDLTKYESPLAVGIGNFPTMREPMKQDNEAIRSNITDFRKQGVINMPFQILGHDGTT